MSSSEIVRSDDAKQSAELLSTQMQYAKLLAQSDLVPAEYRGKPANVLLAVGLGSQIGLNPARSLTDIDVIKGKPTLSAQLIESLVRLAGHKLRVEKKQTPQGPSVTCTIVRKDDPDHPFSVTRDQQWAQNMGLSSRENYRKQPVTMLTWRAITACAREACAEALSGFAYTPDEMHDMDQPQPQSQPVSGGRIAQAAHRVQQAQQQSQPQPQPQSQPQQPQPQPQGEETVDAEPVEEDAPITLGQKDTIHAIYENSHLSEHDFALVVSRIAGKQINSMSELTLHEAQKVITRLQGGNDGTQNK